MIERRLGVWISSLILVAGCQRESLGDGESSTLAAASASVTSQLDEACKILGAKGLPGLETEVAVICGKDQKGTTDAQKILQAAYHGKNSLENASKEIKLQSNGGDTELIFAGAVAVNKSIPEIRAMTKAILSIVTDDRQNGVSIVGKVMRGPYTKGQAQCYEKKDTVTTEAFGLKFVDDALSEDCSSYLDPNQNIMMSRESLMPGRSENDDNPAGNRVVLYFKTGPRSTHALAVIRKVLKNHGFASVAEGKIKSQPQALLAKLHATMAADKPVQTVISDGPRIGDAADNDQIGYGSDWAYGRTKLSCNRGDGVIAVLQDRIYGGTTHNRAYLSLECREVAKPLGLRVEEPASGIPTSYEIKCQEDEYVAGLSFVRYYDKATILVDGTRSLLCARIPQAMTKCEWKDRSCGADQVLNGLKVKREGGLICASHNRSDAGKGCYSVEQVYCCQ